MITGFIIIILASLLLFALALFFFRRNSPDGEGNTRSSRKSKTAAVKALHRRLAQNPKDSGALTALANTYFEEQDWENAFKTYYRLQETAPAEQRSDEFTTILRFALSAVKLENYKTAHKNFLIARGMRTDDPQVNYNLGYLEYMKNNYEKAAGYLSQAHAKEPSNALIMKYLGLSFSECSRFAESAQILSQVVELDPLDKEAFFALGRVYQKLNKGEAALKIFSHLREDPQLGPQAALMAGEKNLSNHQVQKAILDFEIGLRHKEIEPKVRRNLQYRLGLAYIEDQDIAKGLDLLKELQRASPDYQDTEELIKKYSELNANKALQIYLLGEATAFLTLCRRLCSAIFPKTRIKFLNSSLTKNEYADILAEVFTSKGDKVVLFRFIRTTGDVGELVLRDLNAKIKELHARQGVCITAGQFSSGAQHFVEARLIDLIPKTKLSQYL